MRISGFGTICTVGLIYSLIGCSDNPSAVGALGSPHAAGVKVSHPGGDLESATDTDVDSGKIELLPGSEVSTDKTGEVIVKFHDIGNCSLWHNSRIEVLPDTGQLFNVEDSDPSKQLICSVRGPQRVTTAFGVLEVSGTTFGVLVNDDGMTATIYEGHGIVGGLSGGNEIELAAAQTATVGSDGRISEVTSATDRVK